MDQQQIISLTKGFVSELIALSAKGDIVPLLTPENVRIADDKVALQNNEVKPASGLSPAIYPGYSAPEVYQGRTGSATPVYFVGALMYTLAAGSPPPDANARAQSNASISLPSGPISDLVQQAMELDEGRRVSSLPMLLEALNNAAVAPAASFVPPVAVPVSPAPAQNSYMVENPAQAGAYAPPPEAYNTPQMGAPATAQQPVDPARPVVQPVANVNAEPVQPFTVQNPSQAESAPPQADVLPGQGYAAPQSPPPAPAAPSASGAFQSPPASFTAAPAAQPQAGAAPFGAPVPQGQQPGTFGQPVPQQKPKKKKKGKVILIVALILVVLAGAGVGYTFIQNNNANTAWDNHDYSGLVSVLDKTPWIKGSWEDQYSFAKAMQLKEEGDIDGAIAKFEELGSFNGSDEQAKALKYEKGQALLKEGNLKEAKEIFTGLGRYKDSADIANNLKAYMDAENLSDPVEKYNAYKSISGFLDADEKAAEQADGIYETGLDEYAAGNYTEAKECFELFADYNDAALYIEACDIAINCTSGHRDGYYSYSLEYTRLRELAGSIDVGPIITNNAFLWRYLSGDWESSDGGGSFKFDPALGYEFSEYDITGLHYFTEMQMREGSMTGTAVATFTYISIDEMTITFSDGGTYTFKRQ